MDVWHVRCGNCGYETTLNLGSTDLSQTYSDLNEDFAYYKLFVCKKERKFVPVNIHDRHFDNVCPADGGELVPAEEVPPTKCPRCSASIAPKRLDINELLGG
ncbi:MAG: hypothetical protein ACE5JV_01420 [Nitrososphaerales archaeon]